MGTYAFVPLLYVGKLDFFATSGTYTGNILSATLIIIEKIRRHDGFMNPAFQPTGQGWHAFHPPYNFLFPDSLAFLSALFLYARLCFEQWFESTAGISLKILAEARFIRSRVKSALILKIPAVSQVIKRRCTPCRAAIFLLG